MFEKLSCNTQLVIGIGMITAVVAIATYLYYQSVDAGRNGETNTVGYDKYGYCIGWKERLDVKQTEFEREMVEYNKEWLPTPAYTQYMNDILAEINSEVDQFNSECA